MKRSELKQLIREVIEESVSQDINTKVLNKIKELWTEFYFDSIDRNEIEKYGKDKWEENANFRFWTADEKPQDTVLKDLNITLSDEDWNDLDDWLADQDLSIDWPGVMEQLNDEKKEASSYRRSGHPSLSSRDRNL